MDHMQSIPAEVEPAGIVISRGSRTEQPPRFSAYMWSDVPELPVVENSTTARRAA